MAVRTGGGGGANFFGLPQSKNRSYGLDMTYPFSFSKINFPWYADPIQFTDTIYRFRIIFHYSN